MLRSLLAYAVLLTSYGFTLFAAKFARLIRGGRRSRTGRIVVTGTFYNQGWFLSHIVPLAQSGVREVILVTDEPQCIIDGVRFVCPPKWAGRLLGRALSKFLCMVLVGFRHKPDLYMGYHLFPGAISALVVARLFRRPACYQMTGGPIEIVGGGVYNENRLMSSLRRPSALLERMALAIAREFDLVVVRGRKARQFLTKRGLNGQVVIIPGSIDSPARQTAPRPSYGMVFVGRLTEIKQPLQFVEILDAVRRGVPSVRAAMVGDGPLLAAVQEHAERLGVRERIDVLGKQQDVMDVLGRSRVFLLTLRSEGLSISMLEAMGCGLPVVVPDVGELGDLVISGRTGWLVQPNAVEEYAQRVAALLTDDASWQAMSLRARRAATRFASRASVARRWNRVLGPLCGLRDLAPPGSAVAASDREAVTVS